MVQISLTIRGFCIIKKGMEIIMGASGFFRLFIGKSTDPPVFRSVSTFDNHPRFRAAAGLHGGCFLRLEVYVWKIMPVNPT